MASASSSGSSSITNTHSSSSTSTSAGAGAGAGGRGRVLDEDAYLSALESIIQRDFFPHLSKLRAQHEYLQALERKDEALLRAIAAKYNQRTSGGGGTAVTERGYYSTRGRPAETPSASANSDSSINGANGSGWAAPGSGRRRFDAGDATPLLATPRARMTGDETPRDTRGEHSEGAFGPGEAAAAAAAAGASDQAMHTRGSKRRRDQDSHFASREDDDSDEADDKDEDGHGEMDSIGGPRRRPRLADPRELSLDEFLATHTSEDNASFAEIMERTQKRNREKYAWMYKGASSTAKPLALMGSSGLLAITAGTDAPAASDNPSMSSSSTDPAAADAAASGRAIVEASDAKTLRDAAPILPPPNDRSGSAVARWKYTPKNTLMFPVDGVANQQSSVASRVVQHANTRVDDDFLAAVAAESSQKGKQTASAEAAQTPGGSAAEAPSQAAAASLLSVSVVVNAPGGASIRLPRGFEPETPRVGGHSFLSTPTPVPGVDATPMMTWGMIDGTPFRLDAADSTPRHQGPTYSLPEVRPREQIAIGLADKSSLISKSGNASRGSTSSPSFAVPRLPNNRKTNIPPSSPMAQAQRFSQLSPAAQRFAAGTFRATPTRSAGPGSTPTSGGKASFGSDPALRASYSPMPHSGGSSTTPTSR
ncbi:nuclear protein Es2 [Capsaspora owczarzaki ATCC 30864]|uniref:Nuclear protein Es2 n=1 Tax=Capsaspora owczarzaki (strain ATCC 30864) TaxID=595528 RepID=A0A0D2WWF7_CAPO3|nr:nuclear protein Es2 [Capsaspora owczarzaki ATCC 30864]KJE97315.1 nuclear protein Es2 [Capsaspora owczarzaki ATCC 30864]|eukprot:XP_004343617.1 nuclear protein Es2 [Capsaspora owczarzaki ATCC 30864]